MYISEDRSDLIQSLVALNKLEAKRSHQALMDAVESSRFHTKAPESAPAPRGVASLERHPLSPHDLSYKQEALYQVLNKKDGIPPQLPVIEDGKYQPFLPQNGINPPQGENSEEVGSNFHPSTPVPPVSKNSAYHDNDYGERKEHHTKDLNSSPQKVNGIKEVLASAATKSESTPSNSSVPANQAASYTLLFNSLGNFSTKVDEQNFAMLKRNMLFDPTMAVVMQNQNMLQQSASISLQLSILTKLYEILIATKQMAMTQENPNDNAALQQTQILSFVFIDRVLKMLDTLRPMHLSRWLKKGPVGTKSHEDNSDEDGGEYFSDEEGERDYIKRPRRSKSSTNMAFHEAWIR